MPIKAFLSRFVVIRADHQSAGCAGILGVPGQTHRLFRVVGAGPGYDGHSLVDLFDGDIDHSLMLFERKGRRFSGRAARDNAMGPVGNLELDQLSEPRLINLAVLERSYNCHHGALEHS